MEGIVVLKGFDQTVSIEAGELIGYTMDGHEFIHQKGSPGWRSSDTEMFPIIGPTSEANFQVRTLKGMAVQDQHGLLREMAYEQRQISDTGVSFQKDYKAGTRVGNSKFPAKSIVEELYWPYDFRFTKQYTLTQKGLDITFKIEGEEGMPFMLGYHPAFKLHTGVPSIIAKDHHIGLSQVLEVGSRALQVPDCDEVILKDKVALRIRTRGFGHFMLWTEVTHMVCIEPITFYPYNVDQDNLYTGFSYLENTQKEFKVFMGPL